MDDNLSEQIRQQRLDADFNVRYAEYVALRCRNRNLAARVILGICTAGTVTAFLAKWMSPAVSVTLNSVASIVSTVVLPQFKWAKVEGEAIAERKAWAGILADYELLSSSTDDASEIRKEFSRLRRACARQQGNGVILPRIKKLLNKAQDDVATYHQLEVPKGH